MENIVLQVEGMSCEHCVRSVKGALLDLEGVDRAQVSLNENNVTINYEANKVTVDEMKAAIEEQGYDVK
jgi:copper chaperone